MNGPNNMKIALFSPIIKLGDIEHNTKIVLDALERANGLGADFLALPHDVLQGASLGDIATHSVIRSALDFALKTVAKKTKDLKTTLMLNIFGRELYIRNGSIEHDYVCTDAPLRLPISDLPNGATATSDILLRNALRAFSMSHSDRPVFAIMPNIGESGGERVYDGHMALALSGSILIESEPFFDDMLIFSMDNTKYEPEPQEDLPKYTYLSQDPERTAIECERILSLQAHALERRLTHIGGKGFIVGVSGGLDSTLALIAAVRACKLMELDSKEHVLGLSMPGFGTTPRTRANAKKLIETLGAKFEEIDIRPACLVHFDSLGMGHDFGKYSEAEMLVLENAQARERTRILLSISNRSGLLDIGTGDLSEDALGFSTVGGDHLALYGINSSLPKTVIRIIVSHVADSDEQLHDLLNDILNTPVSPELLPSLDGESPYQRTEEILGAYALHDLFILNMLQNNMGPSQLYELALRKTEFTEEAVYDTLGVFLRRFFSQQFKRNSSTEAPCVLFSLAPADFKMPSDVLGAAFMREYENISRRKDKK